MERTLGAALIMTAGILSSAPACAQTADTFFAGRQVPIIVGTGAGRGYDAYARLAARHLGRHMAGNPTFVVENMPGASGIRALNYLYATAPRDGSVIATFNSAIPYYEAVGQPASATNPRSCRGSAALPSPFPSLRSGTRAA